MDRIITANVRVHEMAQLNPQRLLQAAMASSGSGGAPPDQGSFPGAASPAGGAPAGPQGGLQDALPSEFAGAQPVGAENSGVLSTSQMQNQVVGGGSQEAGNIQQIIQAIQDPKTPPDQKRFLQQQLQIAALKSLTSGPSGAAGTPAPS